MFSSAITNATNQAMHLVGREFTNSPIFLLSEVNMTRGITAKLSLLSNGEQVAAVKAELEQTIDLLCGGTLKLLEGGVNPDRFKTHLLAAMVADPRTLDKSEFREAVEFTVKFVCA